MKKSITDIAQALGAGVLVDINRIANSLEELCRQGQEERQYSGK